MKHGQTYNGLASNPPEQLTQKAAAKASQKALDKRVKELSKGLLKNKFKPPKRKKKGRLGR
ncbi:hypothetical protein [Litorimonas haliclonae]|uniref:hypothetical protein n=1 Tax=Litorimonas haliclonae TaxID=2081977 RepID=UPI0039F124B8